jgi:PiT family inorganic phosphate transporter
MNFVGAFLGQEVAQTVCGRDLTSRAADGLVIVMAGLLGAITWNLITWYSACRRRPPRADRGWSAPRSAVALVHWGTIATRS